MCSDRRPSSLKMCLSHLQLLLQTFYQGDGIHFMPEKTAHSFRIPPEETGNCSLSWWPKPSPFGTLLQWKWLLGVAKKSENQFDVTNIPNEASKCMHVFPAFLLPHLFGNVSSINSKGPIRDAQFGWSLNHQPHPRLNTILWSCGTKQAARAACGPRAPVDGCTM